MRGLIYLFLVSCFCTDGIRADADNAVATREFEEFRLRQLKSVQQGVTIKPFTTDACSGYQSQSMSFLAQTFPRFKQEFGDKLPWESCCVTHDRAYWQGDVVGGYQKRLSADLALKQCVEETGQKLAPELSEKYDKTPEQIQQGFNATARMMYRAVRMGGLPCSHLPWRWGYGWPQCTFAMPASSGESVSQLKDDETVQLFTTSAWLSADQEHWYLPIHAWVYEPENSRVRTGIFARIMKSKYDLDVTVSNRSNFDQRTNLMIADNERGKSLVVKLGEKNYELPETLENGHVTHVIKMPVEWVLQNANNNKIFYSLVLPAEDQRQFIGTILLVGQQGLSVISDIDDTVKVSNVTDRQKLVAATFLNDFQPVDGMSEWYKQILSDESASFHFVSSSPWQLYAPITGMLQVSGFPDASLSLKNVRFRDDTLFNLFKPGTETKPAQIEAILNRYPQRQFVLIGDSGEQDPEVYGDIARRFPKQISKIYIRPVDDFSDPGRYESAFAELPAALWQILSTDFRVP